jgi:hypothetical protein
MDNKIKGALRQCDSQRRKKGIVNDVQYLQNRAYRHSVLLHQKPAPDPNTLKKFSLNTIPQLHYSDERKEKGEK